jgi:hypothetical protein
VIKRRRFIKSSGPCGFIGFTTPARTIKELKEIGDKDIAAYSRGFFKTGKAGMGKEMVFWIRIAWSKEKSRSYPPSISKRSHSHVAKVGGLQSQGAKGEAVVVYCDPFATQDLESSGFPEG